MIQLADDKPQPADAQSPHILRSADEILDLSIGTPLGEKLHDIDLCYADWYQRCGWQVVCCTSDPYEMMRSAVLAIFLQAYEIDQAAVECKGGE
jgi:hypothetical protein